MSVPGSGDNPVPGKGVPALGPDQAGHAAEVQAYSTLLLVLRRLRAPLLVLVFVFSVGVGGLTLIPGQDASGQAWRMTFGDAVYFMSYTATTIGYGEIPRAFSAAQRMWVMVCIYLSVVGWAYLVAHVLGLVQDKVLRQAWAIRRFSRRVATLREPFLILAGFGRTGNLIGRALDPAGRRFVVLDRSLEQISGLSLLPFRSFVPALAADPGVPAHLSLAGLHSQYCEGVIAVSDDDRTNLAVVMACALLRPDVQVVARTDSRAIGEHMRRFGNPAVVNPADDIGDRLRVAFRSPATYQVARWLTSPTGSPLPRRTPSPPRGAWVVVGDDAFGREMVADLHDDGLPAVLLTPNVDTEAASLDLHEILVPHFDGAVGLVAGTTNDTVNLGILEIAARMRPSLFVVARRNDRANGPLFKAMPSAIQLVASDVVAHEVLARLTDPLLWDFLQTLSAGDDVVAEGVLATLTARCGPRTPMIWRIQVTHEDAPALAARLTPADGVGPGEIGAGTGAPWRSAERADQGSEPVALGLLLRSPHDRDVPLDLQVLLLQRDAYVVDVPADDTELRIGDTMLVAGTSGARRALDTALYDPATLNFLLSGRFVSTTWIGRRVRGLGRSGGRH